MICDRIYHLRNLGHIWTVRTARESNAKVACIDDLENECSNTQQNQAMQKDQGQQQDLDDGGGEDERISFQNMHVTPRNVANTCWTTPSGFPEHLGVWTCCQCRSSRLTATFADRCPVCNHLRCSNCYDMPCSSTKRRQ